MISFTPLYSGPLWLPVTITPLLACSQWVAKYNSGVGTIPISTTSRPLSRRPATRAPASSGARVPAVAPDDERLFTPVPGFRTDAKPDTVGDVRGQRPAHHSPYVIGAENGRRNSGSGHVESDPKRLSERAFAVVPEIFRGSVQRLIPSVGLASFSFDAVPSACDPPGQ